MRDQLSLAESTLIELPHDKQAEALNEFTRERLKSSLFHLCIYLGYTDVDLKVHGELIACLEDDSPRKIICIPRGTLKSSVASIAYPIWLLIRNPDIRILIDSEIYSNSITYLRAIRMHLTSEPMINLFGTFQTDTLWREDAILIKQRVKNVKEPSITAGGVGTTKVGQHYDLIIGDDYNSPQNTSTKDQAQKVVDHFRYNLNILDPGAAYVIIGTRYGENDLIGWVLQNLLNEPKLAEGNIEDI